jgi:hypothetical protein
MADSKPTGAMAGDKAGLARPVRTTSIQYGSVKAASYSAGGSFGVGGAPSSKGASLDTRSGKGKSK